MPTVMHQPNNIPCVYILAYVVTVDLFVHPCLPEEQTGACRNRFRPEEKKLN